MRVFFATGSTARWVDSPAIASAKRYFRVIAEETGGRDRGALVE